MTADPRESCTWAALVVAAPCDRPVEYAAIAVEQGTTWLLCAEHRQALEASEDPRLRRRWRVVAIDAWRRELRRGFWLRGPAGGEGR